MKWISVAKNGNPWCPEPPDIEEPDMDYDCTGWYVVWTKHEYWDKARYNCYEGKWYSQGGWPISSVTHYGEPESPA